MSEELKWNGMYCTVKDDRGRSVSLTRFGRGLYVIDLTSTFKGSLGKSKKEAERLLRCALREEARP